MGRRNFPMLGAALFLVLLVAFCTYNESNRHWVNHIKSVKYVAPSGCIIKRYHVGDDISSACIDATYVITLNLALSYGWIGGRSGLDYYRVGDDSYQIDCDKDQPGHCAIDNLERDAFAR